MSVAAADGFFRCGGGGGGVLFVISIFSLCLSLTLLGHLSGRKHSKD